MFTKIMKIGQKKSKKGGPVELPIPNSGLNDVTVNHASRPANVPSQPAAIASVPPNPGVVRELPLIKSVPVVERHVLFIRKVHICSILFDFSDTTLSPREKEIKRQTLSELLDFLQSGNCRMNEVMQEELVKMISVNIFRSLPPATHENTGKENVEGEEDDSFSDPSWPHLQLVYELLLRYVVSQEMNTKVAKRYLDHRFISKLLDLFDSEDSREREYLKTILHRIYGTFLVHRPCIRHLMNNIFYRFIFETERHSGISELLEVLGSIINGFALPMKEENKFILFKTLLPLHKPKSISSYHCQLSYCIVQFVEKDYRLADFVICGLLKCWPITNCAKEVLFLGEVEEVLEVTQPAEFQRCMVPLFRQVARCINNQQFQVAERALFLWNNEYILELIAQNRRVILPIIFDALEKNLETHWNQTTLGLTANVRRMFIELDSELFEECERKHKIRLAKAKEKEEQRLSRWKRLEEVAAQDRGPQQASRGEEKSKHVRKKSVLSFW